MTRSSTYDLFFGVLAFAVLLLLVPSLAQAEDGIGERDRSLSRERISTNRLIDVDLFVEDEDGDNFAVINPPVGAPVIVYPGPSVEPTPSTTPQPSPTPSSTPTPNPRAPFVVPQPHISELFSDKIQPKFFTNTPTPTPTLTPSPTPEPTPVVVVETDSQKRVRVRYEETHETTTQESHSEGEPIFRPGPFFDLPQSISRMIRRLFS